MEHEKCLEKPILLTTCNSIDIPFMSGAKTKTLEERRMMFQDERIKLTTEILNGIKVLKFYSWEKPFMEKVEDVRRKEVEILDTKLKLKVLVYFFCVCFCFAFWALFFVFVFLCFLFSFLFVCFFLFVFVLFLFCWRK